MHKRGPGGAAVGVGGNAQACPAWEGGGAGLRQGESCEGARVRRRNEAAANRGACTGRWLPGRFVFSRGLRLRGAEETLVTCGAGGSSWRPIPELSRMNSFRVELGRQPWRAVIRLP